MTALEPPTLIPIPRKWQIPLVVVFLGALIGALHGSALNDGLFLDDHAHYRQLQEAAWTLHDLTDACRLELVGGVVDMWWLPELTLRFFRPLAFGLMKLTYTLTDWNPMAAHVASLLWHWVVCVGLVLLLRGFGASIWLAGGIATLFAIHPGQLSTVQWIACQTELMVTAFLLYGTLCYARFRAWPGFGGDGGESARSGRWGWALLAVVCFVAALGCRENAIMFPLVMLVAEVPLRLPHKRRFWVVMVVLVVVAGVYFWLRSAMLGGMALPPRPYVVPPDAPDFPRFVLEKTCYYVLGEFLLYPCVPIGGLPYLRERPWMLYLPAVLTLLALMALFWRHRREQAAWLGPAWLFGFMAPVLPAFASPHHLYLPGIGWAVLAFLLFRTIGSYEVSGLIRSRVRFYLMWAALVGTGLVFGATTFFFGVAFDVAQGIEDRVAADMIAVRDEIEDGDTLYVGNFPLIAHYAQLIVEERTGLRDLRVVPLMWAPRITGLVGTGIATELVPVDDYTLEVHVRGARFFEGALGFLVSEATGNRIPQQTEESRAEDGFRVEVLDYDEEGVKALRFVFDEPYRGPGRHLFWGSQVSWALPLRW